MDKNDDNANCCQHVCEKGVIITEGPVTGLYLSTLEFDQKLDNFRKAIKQKSCLCEIADSPDGSIYIARCYSTVVGYATFHNPDPSSRWFQHPSVLELGAVEVSPAWRHYKLAQRILSLAFSNPLMENHIVITMEYSWHWDLDGSALSLWNYQKMLTKLFGSVGMQRISTNDPEIMENPANVLMARIGKNITPQQAELFDHLRFSDNILIS